MRISLTPLQQRITTMTALILAGEAIFALPFQVARFFRPILLETTGMTATELGLAQGIYGIVAMFAYFLGGPIADQFQARKLLAVSLWLTALGGLYMATFPGYEGSILLWAFFGVTTILLFWAALIRATRDWGDATEQGKAYGLLDGGRGLLAAVLASIAVGVLGLAFPDGSNAATLEEKISIFRAVIYGYTAVTAVIGLFVWFAIPETKITGSTTTSVFSKIGTVFRYPALWLQAVIIICAYVGYKGYDNYSLFLVDAYGMDPVDASEIVTLGAWMRPIAALGAGFIGDRFLPVRVILVGFVLLLACHLHFAFTEPMVGVAWILIANIVITCIAIYGFRGLYFALFEEARIPPVMTGTAVGIVSGIGYLPEIFVAAVAGYLVDQSPGAVGHQHFFMFMAVFSAIGILASVALNWLLHKSKSAH